MGSICSFVAFEENTNPSESSFLGVAVNNISWYEEIERKFSHPNLNSITFYLLHSVMSYIDIFN